MAEQILIDSGPSERGAHYYELFNRCPQLWSWFFHPAWHGEGALSSKLEASDPLVRGTLVHVGTAHYYARLREALTGGDPSRYFAPLDAIREKVRRMEHAEPAAFELAAKVQPVAEALVNGYVERYRDERLNVLHVEDEFRGRVANRLDPASPYLYTARFDLLYEDEHGGVWGCDHKTSWKIDEQTVQRYKLSLQFLGQQWFGHKVFGDRWRGIKLNLICTRLDAPVLYSRRTLPPAPAMLARFPRIVQDGEERKQLLLNQGRKPDDFPRAASEQVCMTPYGPCPGHELCAWGPDAA